MAPTYYYRQYRSPAWGQSFAGGMAGRLILTNVAAFVLQWLFRPHFTALFALTPRAVVENFYLWQLVTYMFLHGGFSHLLFNMLMLWFFGNALETVWGARQFLKYYIACGIGGGLFSMIFSYNHAVLGASGAIFGVYLAYAMLFPDNYVYLYFLIPVKAKHLVAGIAILQLVLGLSGPSGIAYFAHLGGMAAGLLFFRTSIAQRLRHSFGAQRRWKAHLRERENQPEMQEDANIDSILDKISAKGYDTLTTTEKRILENYSRRHKDEPGE
jgi:membrane associated rhomboid family serine protease